MRSWRGTVRTIIERGDLVNILGSQQPLEAKSHQEGNGHITATNIYSKRP